MSWVPRLERRIVASRPWELWWRGQVFGNCLVPFLRASWYWRDSCYSFGQRFLDQLTMKNPKITGWERYLDSCPDWLFCSSWSTVDDECSGLLVDHCCSQETLTWQPPCFSCLAADQGNAFNRERSVEMHLYKWLVYFLINMRLMVYERKRKSICQIEGLNDEDQES